jgi:RNA polymerase sigma-70 factor (ECF subfamily)
VTQEVFFQLYRSLPRYSGRARFRVWLWSLVRNVCRHRLRKLRRARALRPVEREWEPSEPREIADLAPGVVERLTRGELRERVRVEVARLPEVYRITLVLRDWDELSYVEIAEALSVPVGTVRSRLHKARALLADALRQDALP